MIRRVPLAIAALLTAVAALLPSAPAHAATPVVAASVPTPTSVTVFGTNLYAASWATGNVMAMPILPGGLLGPATPYATGLSSPLGIVFGPDGTLFVADSHASTRPGRATAGRVWAIPPGGGDAAAVGQVVVDELPNGRHNTNGLAVLGGRLYISNGNSTDDGVEGGEPEQPLSGTLISTALTTRGVVVGSKTPSALRVEARGMRNLYDVAFRPGTKQAWIPTNGPDQQDPWGEDLLHVVTVGAKAPDFGFPGCVYQEGPGGPLDPILTQNQNPAVTDRCDGTQTAPRMTLGLHVSADGLAFGPEEGFGGDLYIAEFGNFNGSEVVGHEIVRVPIAANGTAGAPETFLPGGTPLDLTFGPADTGMYVADFGAGQILLVKP